MNRRPDMAVFLERRSYRRRRLMDALRLLPLLGVMLWMLPLFWPSGASERPEVDPVAMSDAVQYVFSVWVFVIGAAFALWFALWRDADDQGEDAEGTPGANPDQRT